MKAYTSRSLEQVACLEQVLLFTGFQNQKLKENMCILTGYGNVGPVKCKNGKKGLQRSHSFIK
jgi:hypothetical protein